MTRTEPSRKTTGDAGELRARQHLETHGLRCLAAGWRCRLGELDLVMLDGDVLVFVEVRARRAGSLVSAIESIDPGKRRRVIRAARAWLMKNPAWATHAARFDVFAIDGEDISPQWLANAFDADGR